MFILALYPGSGETYTSQIFNELLGLEILSYGDLKIEENEENEVDLEQLKNKIVKVIGLPAVVNPAILQKSKIVYVVRDGRDCILNNAHYRKNILDKTTDLNKNIEETILAADGSFFGGWSKHVEEWSSIADHIIKFEELIADPVKSVELVANKILGVPLVNTVVPSYDSMKWGDHIDANTSLDHLEIFPPKSWQEELSEAQHELFMKMHADTLLKFSYVTTKEFTAEYMQYMFPALYAKLGKEISVEQEQFKILIEAAKLQMNYNDGVKRYVIELLKSVKEILKYNSRYRIDVFDGNQIQGINDVDLDYYLNKQHTSLTFLSRLKKYIVDTIKRVLKSLLSVNQYNTLGLTYKSVKAKIFRGYLPQIVHKSTYYIRKNLFRQNVQIPLPTNKLNTSFYDLVHIPLLQDVEYINDAREKTLVTLHDLTHLSHPHYHAKDNIVLADQGLKLCLKYNARFFTISENTKQDLINYSGEFQDVAVVHEAADNKIFFPLKSDYWQQNIRAILGIPPHARYFVSLSTLEPRKNLKNAILAFQEALSELPNDIYFVVAGKEGWRMNEVLPKGGVLSDRIIFTGFIKEELLPWLYREALALVYVSHYEGFGLPLLESMSCGRPVVFGYNSSMIEIVEDTGYPVETESVDSIKAQLLKVAQDTDTLTLKSFGALKRSNDFSWQRTGIRTLAIYENEIKNSKVETVSKNIKDVHI